MPSNGASLPQGKRPSFSHYSSPNASLFVGKTKAGIRRSTPDSEALASSDDEQEVYQRAMHTSAQQAGRSAQRPPWMNENHHALQRKASTSGSEPISPLAPHPVSSPDSSIWTSTSSNTARNTPGGSALPWNNGIWNNDTQKGLPSRFVEVLPSPTSLNGMGSGFGEEPSQSPSRRDSSADAAIPFAIPLQPTLKSYRSQSYSVGQMEQDLNSNAAARPSQHAYNGRTRAGSSYSGLQHRPSRPSMLGEFSAETSILGQLREVDDDVEESITGSETDMRHSSHQSRKMNELAMENAILRQQTALMSQSMGVSMGNMGYGSSANVNGLAGNRGLQMSDSVLEEPDDEAYDDGEFSMNQASAYRGFGGRRFSEYSANPEAQYFSGSTADKISLGALKKGHWQSSLGFGGAVDATQSRRHSFADVPRHASMSAGAEPANIRAGDSQVLPYGEASTPQTLVENASYFSNQHVRAAESYRPTQTHSPIHQTYPNHSQNRAHSYGQSSQAHHGQSLYLVTFKAARAEFYYVQDGTGLEINAGDLVIVEADRGTDLGTVAHKNVDWTQAKDLKEQYVAEHFNWLMMFSRHGQHGGQPVVSQGAPTLGQSSARAHPRAAGGMGPPGAAASADPLNVEIKPKMIKRLAQSHEIHTLREKEGNEAKAKRMCQQKVIEHHLTMEILDAEFQMDWKKLTFYYFADSYINFNSLVTDLFKIYKTRIWMSAINPASFVSPLAGPQLPSGIGGIGPGALHGDRDRFADHHTKAETSGLAPSSPGDRSFEASWQPPIGPLTASSPGAYGQYWSPPGIQQHQHSSTLAHDYGRANNPALGSNLGFAASPYSAGRDLRPRSKPDYNDEGIVSQYADHLQALQGLSLGPA